MMPVDERESGKPTHTMWVCPQCEKTVHISRQYCRCHKNLARARAAISEKPPDIGPCNFETAKLNCGDCPSGEDCKWCPSFGYPKTNGEGFGGQDCRYRTGKTQCYCCQDQIKLSLTIGKAGISDVIRNIVSKEHGKGSVYQAMSDHIHAEMEKLVFDRINHEQEKAG
jgi:hypothetical protein